tara:strand:+ start:3 stop:1115 length:1113 start_codon:yes stop_codon:yes gene_type:complete
MIKIGTDFSGIGSPEQALIKLGIKHKSMFACDVDKYAKKSYLANYNTEKFYDDITKRNNNETAYVDLYVAGFPCQTFSMAGKRQGFDDTRGTLFFDLLKYLEAKKPKYFILENVKGLLSHDKGRTFAIIMDCLAKTVNGQYSFTMYNEGLNYHIYYKVLNTKDYGLPQNRERVFIVGFRDDNHTFRWPKPFKLEKKLADILEKEVDGKFYLSDKAVEKLEIYNKRNEKKGNGFRAKFHNPEIDNMSSLKVGGQGADDLIQVKETKTDLKWVADYRNDEGLRIRKNNLAPCLAARRHSENDISTMPSIIKTDKIRRLTPLECLRLQGFPDEFYYKCKENGLSDTQLYKQAGNSMTVDVVAYLIKEILINES